MTTPSARLRHPLAAAGVLVTTISAVLFGALLIAILAGLVNNPYAGLVVFVAIPALFVLGLVLIPVGMWLEERRRRRHPDAPADWPVVDFRHRGVRVVTVAIAILTAVNIMIVLVAAHGAVRWMESPGFCGQVCHTPMQPQYTAWQHASHSQTACAECHIAEGAGGFVDAKLSGVRQLAHIATNRFPRPIPPGAEMSAGAQARTCVRCHEPGRAPTDQIRVVREYADDEQNSETVTVFRMLMGASATSERAIHWHANPSTRIEYVATDPERQKIPYVKVTSAQGQVKEYLAEDAPAGISNGTHRTMDCIDCHNTVGHPMTPTAEQAVDRAMAAGLVSRNLPFARREGVRLLTGSYPSQEAGARAVDQGVRAFYESHGSIDARSVDRTATALSDLYRRNVFPTMRVTWGSYPDNSGHITSDGCVRCHDDLHTAKDGSAISGDCDYCHVKIETP